MELEEVIKKRKSVRAFKKDDIPDESLKEIISLARLGPSAGAVRGYEAIISRERLNRVEAPVYLVICTDPEPYALRYGERGKNLYSVQDATIFGAYIQLMLVDKGLASVWIGAFREGSIQRMLNTNLHPVAIIALGYENL
jgi:nitroreductase